MGRFEDLKLRLGAIPEGSYIAGISGGADSVALLMMLLPLIRSEKIRIEAVHVNHGIRGEAADRDAEFCRELCGRNNVPFYLFNIDLKEHTDEETARRARFRCFRHRAEETGADGIILTHHADDQAETFIMRLMRGSGPDGLGCMSAESSIAGLRILRPLLSIRRQEIRDALAEEGIAWTEDATNEETDYLRNFIRIRLIPEMEERIPGAAERIARTSEMIREENDLLDGQALEILPGISGRYWINAEELAKLHAAMRSRVLREWWRRNGPLLDERELSAAKTLELRALADAVAGTVNLPGGYRAVRGRKVIHLIPADSVKAEPVSWKPPAAAAAGITLRMMESAGSPGNGKTSQEVPAWMMAEELTLRTREPGDWIRPFGMNGRKKLQDYFTDRGIDSAWRDSIPLLCRGKEVLLAAGVGAGGIPAFDTGADNVRLEWEGEMPWTL